MQQARISREIEFVGDANQEANVKGNLLPKRMCSVDYFETPIITVGTVTSSPYTVTAAGTSASVAASAGGVIGVTFTTGTDDNAIAYLAATPLVFDISQNPAIETKINITDVTGSVVFFGFSDALTETTPAATIDYADGTLAAAATDAVGFVIDADKASSAVYCASIATGGSVTATAAAPSTVWTDGQSKTLRVELDSSGNAKFYIDGALVNYTATAVTDVPLCAMYNVGNRDGSSDTVYARYLAKFQDIP